jgi:2'-5' RNA ligase
MPTIGVALAIPEPWATQLQDYRTSVGDSTATMIPTHITLIPPTEVDDAELRVIESHLEAVAARVTGFTIHLRGTGTFRPVSPVVFVTVAEGISQCEQLAAALRQGPLAVNLQFPYHPHVTIAHHLPDDALDRAFTELASFDSVFDATEFHLYVHDEESGWKPTRDFPLGSARR